ncbi:hypothetical protein ABZ719_00965 [Streptomyces sp. NPDC006743]|uniref:hypothetical protein n=1 Tax=Streptomyces sp. NPDC006743 TaxID=3154480 RepID=UPI0034529AB6
MRNPSRRAAAAVAVGAALAFVGVSAPTASAADACVANGPAYYCHNVYGAAVYNGFDNPGPIVGRMYTTYSWFSCRVDNGAYVGGPHPYRWLLTKADNGVWGFMKDTSISSETDPVIPC